MALFPKTPGVYVQEISTLPSSVVPVPTAIPVFVGYTEQAKIDGVDLSLPTNPVRVESLLQFQNIFGNAFSESFKATLTTSNVDIAISNTSTAGKDFRLFYNLQMYFANGGGPCYIISTGLYNATTITPVVSSTVLANAIPKAEQVDEITLVVVPDAMAAEFTDADHKKINDAMLAHCAKMQDRFALLDVQVVPSNTIKQDSDAFRNNAVGANNLNYGAAYYPSFDSALSFAYINTDVTIDASDPNLPASVAALSGKNLDEVANGKKGTATVTINTVPNTSVLTINGFSGIALSGISGLTANAVAANLATYINATAPYNSIVVATNAAPSNIVTLTAITSSSSSIILSSSNADTTASGPIMGGLTPDGALASRIAGAIAQVPLELYPSATMAGIYAAVDNDRGVWKAPANVGVTLVDSLNRNINDADQSGLNVDPTSGKSIDAIRNFEGRGMLVWGARTLEGNSNDFRYINVRRTLIFIEDSCKHASEFVVFEPNDKNTWIRVKGMISNFLTNLWRQGGLVGDKPEQAFFVKIGLGETMTAQDILEGKLIVTIGVAISHPAEFVILNFMHKLQEA